MVKIKCVEIKRRSDGYIELDCDMPSSGKVRRKRKVTARNICVGVQMRSGKNMRDSQDYCGKHQNEYQKQADEENEKRGLM